MTGYQSKRLAAQDKLEDDDTQVYQDDALTIAYQSGFYDGKKAAQRPWVGLKEEEQAALIYKYGYTPVSLCLETERKLKEKNNG